MRKPPGPGMLLVIALAGFSALASASVEKARLLHEAMLFDDAKRELIDTIASTAGDDEKAAALHLLGTIAVDEKRYEAAIKIWTDLQGKYPESEDSRAVKGKIPLVRQLAEQSARTPTAGSPSEQSASGLQGVVIAGGGAETRYLEQAVDEISAFLIGHQVQASKPQNWRAPLTELVPMARRDGARAILILNIKFGYLESLRAECYLSDGKLLWEEKASGSFGISSSGVAAGLISRMKSKLEKRLGDACLSRS